MGRTVLIDADILAFQVASSLEQVFEFNGEHVLHADLKQGIIEVDNAVGYILERVDADQAALFLTGTDNFRKKILPSYKANRIGARKPMILSGLRKHMQDAYKLCFIEDQLEGDDLIGIHATKPHNGERVIYSADKDLRTIPGLHWDGDDGEVIEVSLEDADFNFFMQTLTGDPTDNYKGCPGIGKVKAERILNKAIEDGTSMWEAVVNAYSKAKLSEKDALQQARCARILRHGEFDFETKKVNLWTPM